MVIKINRSETKRFRFQRKDSTGAVITAQPDDIYFSIKKNHRQSEVVLQKRLSTGGISFSSADNHYYLTLTASEMDDVVEGEYVCDLKLMDDGVETYLLPLTPLIVCPVVTRLENEE